MLERCPRIIFHQWTGWCHHTNNWRVSQWNKKKKQREREREREREAVRMDGRENYFPNSCFSEQWEGGRRGEGKSWTADRQRRSNFVSSSFFSQEEDLRGKKSRNASWNTYLESRWTISTPRLGYTFFLDSCRRNSEYINSWRYGFLYWLRR